MERETRNELLLAIILLTLLGVLVWLVVTGTAHAGFYWIFTVIPIEVVEVVIAILAILWIIWKILDIRQATRVRRQLEMADIVQKVVKQELHYHFERMSDSIETIVKEALLEREIAQEEAQERAIQRMREADRSN